MRYKDVVVIGGGITGCAIAYELAKKGIDVTLVERGCLASGATGRCGAGIRQQFSTEPGCKLAMASVHRWMELEEELGCDIEYHQGGYVYLAYTKEGMEQFEKNVALQRGLGLDVALLDPVEVRRLAPILDTKNILGATYCPTDGYANPFKVTTGYANAAKKLGTQIETFTEAIDIRTRGDHPKKICGVLTSKGEIKTEAVVLAAGSDSLLLAQKVGVELPITPYRHEIMVTDPLEHILEPMIISPDVYFHQTDHGEIVGGMANPDEVEGFNTRSSLNWLEMFAERMVKLIPSLASVNVVRQWAGLYDTTPDDQPILGKVKEVEGFVQCSGFSGHGFMLAPAAALGLSELIVDGHTSIPIKDFNLSRYEEGKLIRESAVV